MRTSILGSILALVPTVAAQSLSWIPGPSGAQAPTPPRFVWQSLVFDQARSVFVLFGGSATSAYLADTWTFNGTAWMQQPASGPNARSSPAMAYDPSRAETVLFGGMVQGGSTVGDTWVWSGAAWTLRNPVLSPSPRYDSGFVADTSRNRMILFGGWNSSGWLNDTWSWDGANWTVLSPSVRPPARERPAMAYDPQRDRVVLFGGDTSTNTFFGDTWEFDGSSWTAATPAAAPPARSSSRMVYVPSLHGVLLFGGIHTSVALFNDTWLFDGTTWTQITPLALQGLPSPRDGAGMAIDPVSGRVLVVQGRTSAGNPSDTWWLLRASFTQMGIGCAGSAGAPLLNAGPGSLPVVGQTFSMQITNLPNVLTVVLPWIGLSSQTWGPFNLPRSLAMHGMPGCTQYASVDATYLLPLAPTGSIGWQLPIPSLSSLIGQTVFWYRLS